MARADSRHMGSPVKAEPPASAGVEIKLLAQAQVEDAQASSPTNNLRVNLKVKQDPRWPLDGEGARKLANTS